MQSFAVVGALLCSLGQAGARAPARQQVQSELFLTSGIGFNACSVFTMVDIVGKPRMGGAVAGCGEGATTQAGGVVWLWRQSPTSRNVKCRRTAAIF